MGLVADVKSFVLARYICVACLAHQLLLYTRVVLWPSHRGACLPG
jgi:hypothetical protein